MTRHRLGLLLVLAGTVLLAFSVRVTRAYEGEVAKMIDEEKKRDPRLLEPTETEIVLWQFRLGLALIAVGTAFQW